MRISQLMICGSLAAVLFGCFSQQLPNDVQQFVAKVGPAMDEDAIRDQRIWLNPSLGVCDVVLMYTRSSSQSRMVKIDELRQVLLDLPVDDWPFGRIVGLSSCSLRVPGDEKESRERMSAVESALKNLQLEISRLPS